MTKTQEIFWRWVLIPPKKRKRSYEYYVVVQLKKDNSVISTSYTIETDYKLNSNEAVRKVQKTLAKKVSVPDKDIFILNWKLLKIHKGKRFKMTAKEMFEALGYEFIESKELIQYLIDGGADGDYMAIEFWLNEHTFSAQYNYEPKEVTMSEYKAIQQQIKELGWI